MATVAAMASWHHLPKYLPGRLGRINHQYAVAATRNKGIDLFKITYRSERADVLCRMCSDCVHNVQPPRSPSGDALQQTQWDQAHLAGGSGGGTTGAARFAQTPTTASADRLGRMGSSPLANSNLPGGVLSTPSGDQYDSGSSLLSDRFLRIER